MKIKYECTVVEKYFDCEIITLEVCEGNRSVHSPLIFRLYGEATLVPNHNPERVKYIRGENPKWGKYIPGEIYWVDISLAPEADR